MSSTTERERTAADLLAELSEAAEALDDAEVAVTDIGEDRIDQVEDVLDDARTLLGKYRESATGTGNYRAYVEFKARVSKLVEEAPEDLPRRDALETFEETFDQNRLHESEFERGREVLEPLEEVVGLLDERGQARRRYREARQAVRERLSAVEDELAEVERVQRLGEVDIDAPVGQIQEPIDAYDDAVEEAFIEFRRSAAAREVLDVLASAASRPLIDLEKPPTELRSYVREEEVGTEPIPTLLEYAGYSRSKLGHYVDEPGRFMRIVGGNRTYLEGLDAESLTVEWPPPSATTLQMRSREYESVLRLFTDSEVLTRCREVRQLTHRDDYADLREVAVAREELTDEQHRKLREGTVEDELRELRERHERLQTALEEHDER